MAARQRSIESTLGRKFIHRPPAAGASPSAVVLVLHGSAGMPSGATDCEAAAVGLETVLIGHDAWPTATIVFLTGRIVGTTNKMCCWAAGSDLGHCSSAIDGQDEAYVNAVLDWLPAPSQSKPVYLFGYSGGARYAWRVACDGTVASRLSAIGVHSGLLAETIRDAADPTSVCALGSLPQVVAFHGGADATTGVAYADATAHWFQMTAGCASTVSDGVLPGVAYSNAADYQLQLYAPCANASGASLAYYRLNGWGHNLLGGAWLDVMWQVWTTGPSSSPGIGVNSPPSVPGRGTAGEAMEVGQIATIIGGACVGAVAFMALAARVSMSSRARRKAQEVPAA